MRVSGSTKSGLPVNLSAYVKISGRGYTADAMYLVDTVNKAGFNSARIAGALTSDPKILGRWDVVIDTDTLIKLKRTDSLGNVDYLYVKP